jgi:hypothetical protein
MKTPKRTFPAARNHPLSLSALSAWALALFSDAQPAPAELFYAIRVHHPVAAAHPAPRAPIHHGR